MTGIGKLLHSIGDFFTHLFSSAAKTWKKVSPELQAALLVGSDIVNELNLNIDQTPDFIIDLLLQKHPELTKEQLHAYLQQASSGLATAHEINNQDLETTISALQKFMGSLEGSTWAKISNTLAAGIAAAKAPAGTKFAAISSLLNYVYHAFIKK